MLEPPAISETALVDCLRSEYGLPGCSLAFLPVGADLATAVYRATTGDGRALFVKLRFGPFEPMAALLTSWLAQQGVAEIIAPLVARSERLYASMPGFTTLVYPFVEGQDAYETRLTDEQWVSFGRAVRRVHEAPLPTELAARLPREQYGQKWRSDLRDAMAELDVTSHRDPTARRFAEFMGERRLQVLDLIERTERLAQALRAEPLPFVLCHTDLHPGNLLTGAEGRLYIVDWDAPLLAPRERDLMYPGGAQGFPGRNPGEEEALFYRGYGAVAVDLRAVAYYRLERIIEDLAIFCDQLLSPGANAGGSGDTDREQALGWAKSNFEPGRTLEIADRTYRRALEAFAGRWQGET